MSAFASGGIVLLSIAFVVLIIAVTLKNSLIAKENQVENAFSLVDVMLKQRFDLIPQLISCVNGYMEHETNLLQNLVELRSRPGDAEHLAKSNHELKDQFSQFTILAESYPDLKASEQFSKLQRSINEMEEQLAAARRTYNSATEAYNNAVMQFPSSVIAGMNKMTKKEYLVFND